MGNKPVIDLRIYTNPTPRHAGVSKAVRGIGAASRAQASRRAARVLRHQIGPLNQVVHLWKFDDLADLEQRHAALANDPDFAKYLAATEGLVVAQEDWIMRPVEFKNRPGPVR